MFRDCFYKYIIKNKIFYTVHQLLSNNCVILNQPYLPNKLKTLNYR